MEPVSRRGFLGWLGAGMAGIAGGSLFLPKKVEASDSVLTKPLIQTVSSGGGTEDQYFVQEATVVNTLGLFRDHCTALYSRFRGQPVSFAPTSTWNIGQKVVTVVRISSVDLKTKTTYGEFLRVSA